MVKRILAVIILFGAAASICLAYSAGQIHQYQLCLAWGVAALGQLYISIDILTSDN